jgi:C-terminal processing protease CtpA/Prc
MGYLTTKPYKIYEKAEIKISAQTHERIKHLRRQVPEIFANKKDGDIVTLELPPRQPADNPFRFTGRIFLLISRQSFSASTVFASAIKCAEIATLIGEETGDPTTLYADSIKFELPNSGLHAWIASKLLISACGKPDGRGVLPDYEVKQKLEDTAKGVDTVLQFTLDLIKKSEAKK